MLGFIQHSNIGTGFNQTNFKAVWQNCFKNGKEQILTILSMNKVLLEPKYRALLLYYF